MIVADEDDIDLRQILEPHARRTHPLRAGEGEGRGAVRPDRVGEDVDALRLHQHGGMADPGDPQLLAFDAARRHSLPNRDALRPSRPLGTEHPVDVALRIGAILREARVEEALSVIMAARGATMIDPVEEWRHQCRREAERHCQEQQGLPQSSADPADA